MPAKKGTKTDTIKKEEELTIKRRAFLAAYAEVGNITQAAKIANVNRTNHYEWLQDEQYKAAFEDAYKEACDYLEAEARRRAVQGTAKPVFYQGMECGTIQEYSDTLLMFLMKGAMPDKYAERTKAEHTGKDGGPIEINTEERKKRIEELMSKMQDKK